MITALKFWSKGDWINRISMTVRDAKGATTSGPLAGQRIALMSRHHPYFLKSGMGTYLDSIIQGLLEAGAEVRLLVTERPAELSRELIVTDPTPSHVRLSCRIQGSYCFGGHIVTPWLIKPRLRSLYNRIKGRLKRLLTGAIASPPNLNRKWPAWDETLRSGEAQYLRREVLAYRPTAVLFNYSWMAPFAAYLRRGRSRPQSAVLTLDVRHEHCALEGGVLSFRNSQHYSRMREISELNQVDTIVAIQAREARRFQEMVPGKNVVTVYPPINPKSSLERDPIPGRCLLVGSNNAANAEGTRWFLDQVWPGILAAMPEARLNICGDVGRHALLGSLPTGVKALGRVRDLESEYRSASVVLAPLLFGSGIKLKVMEAIAHGCAIVGTSVAMDGIEPLPQALAPYDQPEAFSARVLQLLADTQERTRAEQAAVELTREHFSAQRCLAPLIQQLQKPKP